MVPYAGAAYLKLSSVGLSAVVVNLHLPFFFSLVLSFASFLLILLFSSAMNIVIAELWWYYPVVIGKFS